MRSVDMQYQYSQGLPSLNLNSEFSAERKKSVSLLRFGNPITGEVLYGENGFTAACKLFSRHVNCRRVVVALQPNSRIPADSFVRIEIGDGKSATTKLSNVNEIREHDVIEAYTVERDDVDSAVTCFTTRH